MKYLFVPPKVGLIKRRHLFDKAYIVGNKKDLADLFALRQVLDASMGAIRDIVEEDLKMSKITNIFEAIKFIQNLNEFGNVTELTPKNYRTFLDELRNRRLREIKIKEVV